MNFWICILAFTYVGFCTSAVKMIKSNRNSTIYEILGEPDFMSLPVFVVIPCMDKQYIDESINANYKLLKTKLSLSSASEWFLKVHINQQFFYNDYVNQIVHVLCYLRFSIENITQFVGMQVNCVTFLNWSDKSLSKSATCAIKIGRSPSFCSTYFDLSGPKFKANSPTWGSINAQLFMSTDFLMTNSTNSIPLVLNHYKPVNWTVVQRHHDFGQLAIGLPFVSVKAGTHFLIPISITNTDDITNIRILFEYDTCLSLNNVDIIDKNRWSLKTEFKRSEFKESGVIKLNNLDKFVKFNTSSEPPIVATMNVTVTEKSPPKPSCDIKVGILKLDLLSGVSSRFYNKMNFSNYHRPVAIAIDPDMMDIISFKETTNKTVHLFGPTNPVQFPVSTYLIQKLGDNYLAQLLRRSVCSVDNNSQIITCPGYESKKIGNSWALSVRIEHYQTVLYDLENMWQPESWHLDLSDMEMNPVSDWRVPQKSGTGDTGACRAFYQSARLRIGVKLSSINSMGLKTYLGATLENPSPWIDVTREIVSSYKVTSDPVNVVTLTHSKSGDLIVKVNETGHTSLNLHDSQGQLLVKKSLSVFSSHWASVVAIKGRCISQIGLRKMTGHPGGEGEYVIVAMTSGRQRNNVKCRLWLSVVFNDESTMALEDVNRQWYELQIGNGVKIDNGDMIEYRRHIAIVLIESQWCDGRRIVYRGHVDLTLDGNTEADYNSTSHSIGNVTGPRIVATLPSVDQSMVILPNNFMIIAAYVIVSFIGMALLLIAVNCFVGASVRRQPLFSLRRRLSKPHQIDSGHDKLTSTINDPYPSLLPPPGPILLSSANKLQSDWTGSSESGLGKDHSSPESHRVPVSHLSTFRCPPMNGSVPVRQTSPIGDTVMESVGDSPILFANNHFSPESRWPSRLLNFHHYHQSSLPLSQPTSPLFIVNNSD